MSSSCDENFLVHENRLSILWMGLERGNRRRKVLNKGFKEI